jgi:hypothetical protein
MVLTSLSELIGKVPEPYLTWNGCLRVPDLVNIERKPSRVGFPKATWGTERRESDLNIAILCPALLTFSFKMEIFKPDPDVPQLRIKPAKVQLVLIERFKKYGS